MQAAQAVAGVGFSTAQMQGPVAKEGASPSREVVDSAQDEELRKSLELYMFKSALAPSELQTNPAAHIEGTSRARSLPHLSSMWTLFPFC